MSKDVTSITKSLDRIADALEGGSSGGGGSDDLTVADVTVNNTSENSIYLAVPNCNKTVVGEERDTATYQFMVSNGTEHIKAILYKGLCQFQVIQGGVIETVSGNAEKSDDFTVFITGDCTITLEE